MQQPWSKGIQLLLRLTILEEHEVLLASHKRQTINHKHHTTYKMLLICCGEVNIFKLKPFKESAEVVNDPNAHVSLRNLLLFSIRRTHLLLFSIRRTLAAWNHHPETRRHRKNSRKRILMAGRTCTIALLMACTHSTFSLSFKNVSQLHRMRVRRHVMGN